MSLNIFRFRNLIWFNRNWEIIKKSCKIRETKIKDYSIESELKKEKFEEKKIYGDENMGFVDECFIIYVLWVWIWTLWPGYISHVCLKWICWWELSPMISDTDSSEQLE